MSATHERMTTALAAMEQALTDLAAARDQYRSASAEASRAVYADGGQYRQFEVVERVGPTRVDRLLAGRFVALGLRSLLAGQSKGQRVSPEWVSTLSAEIERLVP